MRALISSYAFIRLSVLVLDFPHLSLRRDGAFTQLIWLFSLNCRQLKSCHVRVGKKVMNMEHRVREVCRDRSLSSEGSFLQIIGKHKDHLTVCRRPPPHHHHLCLARRARDSPTVGPEVLKMQSPVFPGC